VVTRGEIWLVALDPVVGREIKKTRPALVVSPNEINSLLDTAIVAPMTTGASPTRYRVPIVFQDKRGLILADQVRAVARQRFVRRLGRISGKTLNLTLEVLQAMFAE
jgi:mRNA interferase MazF